MSDSGEIFIKEAKVCENYKISVSFSNGENRLLDFRFVPLEGAYTRISSDQTFFKTMRLKDGHLFWGDLSFQNSFLYAQSFLDLDPFLRHIMRLR